MSKYDFRLNFAQMAVMLSEMHDIAPAKGTAFLSRLKNFHRLGWPVGFKAAQGKKSYYGAGDLVSMALALELTQLGLTPERVVRVLSLNMFPVTMAITMAARTLSGQPEGFVPGDGDIDTDPLSMFLFFDPCALGPLQFDHDVDMTPDLDEASNTFFYGGIGVVRENLVKWTSGLVPRISLINVTALLDNLAGDPNPERKPRNLVNRRAFFRIVGDWASSFTDKYLHGVADAARDFLGSYVPNMLGTNPRGSIDDYVIRIRDSTGLPTPLVREMVSEWLKHTRQGHGAEGLPGDALIRVEKGEA